MNVHLIFSNDFVAIVVNMCSSTMAVYVIERKFDAISFKKENMK